MPLLLRTLLAAVPAGASPPLAIAAVALAYVLTVLVKKSDRIFFVSFSFAT